jgi:preprotein translocase subunit YajC
MNQINSGWVQWTVMAQTTPQAGSAPAQPQTPVGVPGAGTGTTAPAGGGTTAAPVGGGAPPAQSQSPLSGGFMFIMIGLLAVLMLSSVFAGRKDKKRRADLMSSVKKGDKVQMIGGIIGNVVEAGDDEVVLKVEEGRIRFHKSAIQGVLSATKGKADGQITEVKGEAKATAV